MKKLCFVNPFLAACAALVLCISFTASIDDNELALDNICDSSLIFYYSELFFNSPSTKHLSFQKECDDSLFEQIILFIEQKEKSPPAIFC